VTSAPNSSPRAAGASGPVAIHAIRSFAVDPFRNRTGRPLLRRMAMAVGLYSATWPLASTITFSVTKA
jgi:hypothetical protein